jgi:hypothetical protein
LSTLRVSIQNNFPDVAARLRLLGRQAPFVAAVSLTKSVKDGQAAIRAETARAFDRPTSYALNSTFVRPATKTRLESRVWIKDEAGKGTPAERFLLPEIDGGMRGQKGMERLLQRAGIMKAGWYAIPAAGAQMDSNGNVKRAQIVQILSQLKLQRSAGFESRATGSARSNRSIARQGITYFALPVQHRGLKPGIYLKRRFGHGAAVKPVFVFVPSLLYRPRLRFYDVGNRTIRARFPINFDAEWTKAVTQARLQR